MKSLGLWRIPYALMRFMPSRFFQRALWWILRKSGVVRLICDEGYLKLKLLANTGEVFAMPGKGGGINSCILWQMLNWKSDLPSVCSDKYAVRQVVKERWGADILIPLLPGESSYWTRAEDVDFSKLPERFVLKCNNGSHMNLVVKDKHELDEKSVRAELARWLKVRYEKGSREKQYASIRSKVICEMLIETADGKPPHDYKIFCSDGKPLFVWVDVERFGENQSRAVFSIDWKWQDVRISAPMRIPDGVIRKPKNWDKMVEIAAALSRGIPFVRIDLYNENGKIYFGEYAFTSSALQATVQPFEWGVEMVKDLNFDKFCQN